MSATRALILAALAFAACDADSSAHDDLGVSMCVALDPTRPCCDTIQPGSLYPSGVCAAGAVCSDYASFEATRCQCMSGHWECFSGGAPRDMAHPLTD